MRAVEAWVKREERGDVMYEWRVLDVKSVEDALPTYPTARYVGGVLEYWNVLDNAWLRVIPTSQHMTVEEAGLRGGRYRLVAYPDTTYAESPDVRDATLLYTKGDDLGDCHDRLGRIVARDDIIKISDKWDFIQKDVTLLTEQYATNHALGRGSDYNDFNILVDAMALFAATRHDLIDRRREGRAAWFRTIEAAWRVELSDQQREQFSEQVRMFRTMLTHLVQRT